MHLSKRRIMRKGLIATAAAAGLVLGSTSPASAAAVIAGAGVGTGGDQATTTLGCGVNPLAAFASSYTLDINDYGTYSGVSGLTPVVYLGPSKVSIVAAPHYISPVGTHDAVTGLLTQCTVPTPVSITATVTTPGGGGIGTTPGINCTASTVGFMTRIQSAVTIEFASTSMTACTVVGNQVGTGVAAQGLSAHVINGTLTPCDVPPPIIGAGPENDLCTLQRLASPPPPTPAYPPVGTVGSLWLGTYVAGVASAP